MERGRERQGVWLEIGGFQCPPKIYRMIFKIIKISSMGC